MEKEKDDFNEIMFLVKAIINEIGFDYNRFVNTVEKIGVNIIFDVENLILLYLIPYYKEHKDIKNDIMNMSPYHDILSKYSKDVIIKKINNIIDKLNNDYSPDEYALMFIIAILRKFMLKSIKNINYESIDSLFSGILIYSVFNNTEFDNFVGKNKMPETIRKFTKILFDRISYHLKTYKDELMRIHIVISFINSFMIPYINHFNKMKKDTKDMNTVMHKNPSFIYIEPKNKNIN